MSAYPSTCLLGARLNAFRLNYLDGRIYISIGGVTAALLIDSVTIADRLNEVPNTLIATVRGAAPAEGAHIEIRLGSTRGVVLFGGNILRVTRRWAAQNPRHVLHDIEATDPTWALGAVLFSARYRNQSASTIATDILTRWAPAGFAPRVEPGLPVLDEITFTNATIVDAFTQLATRIGGYTRVDYDGGVYLFLTPVTASAPAPIDANHPSLAGVTYARDLTQVITRAIVEGGGGNATADVPVGSSVLPVDPIAWYSNVGGFVRSGPQRITYTGIQAGGVGSLVGPGVTPAAAPAAGATGGLGLGVGTYQYAYTWATAAGESKPSPIVAVATSGPVAAPTRAPANIGNTTSSYGIANPAIGYVVGASVQYAAAYSAKRASSGAPDLTIPVNGDPLSDLGPPVNWTLAAAPLSPSNPAGVRVNVDAPTDPAACAAMIYMRIFNAGAWSAWNLATDGGGNPKAVRGSDGVAVASGFSNLGSYLIGVPPGVAYPFPSVRAATQQVQVSGISPGPGTVTKRRLYRSLVNGAVLYRRTELADNTTTSLLDAAADSTLSGQPVLPTSDSSGLVVAAGQVNAGSTEIPVAGTGPFPPTGGLVQAGDGPYIKYTGITGNSLTGIPATGPGSITVTLPYNQQIVLVSLLLGIPPAGVGAIVWPVKRGDPVNVVAIVDDVAAQNLLANKLGGGNGVRESLLQDGRISLVEATARGRALLAGHADVRQTFAHRSRDINTASGAVVNVSLPAPTSIVGTFRLQDVTITTFNARGLVPPTFAASSSSQRFTFEDLLRQIANTSPPPATGEE